MGKIEVAVVGFIIVSAQTYGVLGIYALNFFIILLRNEKNLMII